MTERAAFNLRLRIEGEDRAEVWALLNDALAIFRENAPPGVSVGWADLRPQSRSRWAVTMEPKLKRKAK